MKQEHLGAIIKTAVIAAVALVIAFNFDFFLDLALGILSIVLTIAFVAVLVWFCVKFRIWEMVMKALPAVLEILGAAFEGCGSSDDCDVHLFYPYMDQDEYAEKERQEFYERQDRWAAYEEQQYWDNINAQRNQDSGW